ncbi:MAG: hypothetical protein GY757_07180, partial [bacterium]|nr:hypothetical protein [bacterium]
MNGKASTELTESIRFVFFCILFTFFLAAVLHPAEKTNGEDKRAKIQALQNNWEYRTGDSPLNDKGIPVWCTKKSEKEAWKSTRNKNLVIGFFTLKMNNTIWFRFKLPEHEVSRASISLFNCFCDGIEVFCGERSIYRSGRLAGKRNSTALTNHLFPLPDDYSGRYLYLKFFYVSHKPMHLYMSGPPVRLGDTYELTHRLKEMEASTIESNLLEIFTAFLSFFIGLFSLLFFFLDFKHKNYPALYFGIFVFYMVIRSGERVILNSPIFHIFNSTTLFWTYLHLANALLFPVFILLFFRHLYGKGWKNCIDYLFYFSLASALILFPISYWGAALQIRSFKMFAEFLFMVSLIICTIHIFLQPKKKKKAVGINRSGWVVITLAVLA